MKPRTMNVIAYNKYLNNMKRFVLTENDRKDILNQYKPLLKEGVEKTLLKC